MFGIWINRFRKFSKRAALTPDEALVIAMALLTLKNPLRLKSRGTYTAKYFVDDIQIINHCHKLNNAKIHLQTT